MTMLQRIVLALGGWFIVVGRRLVELSDVDVHGEALINRAKWSYESRHTALVIHRRRDCVEVAGCGRVVRFKVGVR